MASIEMQLDSLAQLFDSLDPAPFHDRSLDRDAEAWLVESVDEVALKVPLELVQLADPQFVLDKADIPALLKKENEPGAVLCSDPLLARFLDGLVVWRRGRDESLPPRPVEDRISNNLVLKKLRVAFELKDVDMHEVFSGAGFPITKPELTALFRQPGHKNYRPCGDQILRNFLKGLTLRFRTGE